MNLKNFSRYGPDNPLVDDLIDSYVSWREQCAAVSIAYLTWVQAASEDRDDAYAAYVATVDREELAATDYRLQVERLRTAPKEVSAVHR